VLIDQANKVKMLDIEVRLQERGIHRKYYLERKIAERVLYSKGSISEVRQLSTFISLVNVQKMKINIRSCTKATTTKTLQ